MARHLNSTLDCVGSYRTDVALAPNKALQPSREALYTGAPFERRLRLRQRGLKPVQVEQPLGASGQLEDSEVQLPLPHRARGGASGKPPVELLVLPEHVFRRFSEVLALSRQEVCHRGPR